MAMRKARKRNQTYESSQIPAGELPTGKIILFVALLGLFAYLLYSLWNGAFKSDPVIASPDGPTIPVRGLVVDDRDHGIANVQVTLGGDTTLSGFDGDFVLAVPEDMNGSSQSMVVTHPESNVSVTKEVTVSAKRPVDYVFVFSGKTRVITQTVPAPQQPRTTNPVPQSFTPQTTQPRTTIPSTINTGRGNQLMIDAGWDAFVQRDRELAATFNLVDLETNRTGAVSTYSGVWSGGAGDTRVFRSTDWPTFRSTRQQLRAQGYRIVDVEVAVGSGDFEYVGLFRRASADHKLWVGLTWQEFLQKRSGYLKDGLQLFDVEGYTRNGVTKYAGIWKSGGADKIWKAKDNGGFISRHRGYRTDGYYLSDFELVLENGANQYIGVWLPGSAGNKIWINDAQTGFENKGREFAAEGLELIDLEVRRNGSRNTFSGAWVGGLPNSTNSSSNTGRNTSGDFKLLEE
ncbi:MAG: hypothetical protein ACRBF0_07705 [Calditrichia bacterium]